MTKHLGTDYDRREKRKPSAVLPWVVDLLTPLVLVAIALGIGRYFFAY